MFSYEFEISETTECRGHITVEASNKREALRMMQAKIDKHDLNEVNWNYSNNVVPCKIESIECWDHGEDDDEEMSGAEPREGVTEHV